jgi:hypothetical protein
MLNKYKDKIIMRKLKTLTHNQVVPGSSPGGPTENQSLTEVIL